MHSGVHTARLCVPEARTRTMLCAIVVLEVVQQHTSAPIAYRDVLTPRREVDARYAPQRCARRRPVRERRQRRKVDLRLRRQQTRFTVQQR